MRRLREQASHAFDPDVDMTDKARRYMGWVAIYCLLMALVCIATPDRLAGPSFAVLSEVNRYGMQGWGWVHLVVGLTAVLASTRRLPTIATLALMGVAGLALPFAMGFLLAFINIPGSSPTAAIIYGVWAAVNIDQSRNPLSAPMEKVILRMANSHP